MDIQKWLVVWLEYIQEESLKNDAAIVDRRSDSMVVVRLVRFQKKWCN
jgi:hypothetical protein